MVVLGIPTTGSIPVKVCGCIDSLLMSRPGIIPYYTEGSLVYDARGNIANYAIEKNADLLFVDSDICFPLEGFDRLVAHNTDIVSGLYYGRNSAALPIAYSKVRPGRLWSRPVRERIKTIEPYMEIEGAGLGFCLIKCDVLRSFKGRNPFEPFGGIGEDFAFFYRCRKKGYKIMLDTTFELKHLGEYAYSYRDTDKSASDDCKTAFKRIMES